jgi:hypothetical protein
MKVNSYQPKDSIMSNNGSLSAKRMMVWEQAKAELESIRCAQHYGLMNGDERHRELGDLLERFIKDVERAGLQE